MHTSFVDKLNNFNPWNASFLYEVFKREINFELNNENRETFEKSDLYAIIEDVIKDSILGDSYKEGNFLIVRSHPLSE